MQYQTQGQQAFGVEGAPVVNKRLAIKLIHIALSNGKNIKSTHTCNLDIP